MISLRLCLTSLAIAGVCLTVVPTAYSLGKIGRGTINVSATLNVEYDSNIFANAGKVDDMAAIFTPGISYSRSVGTISTSAKLGVRSISFTDTSGQDSFDPFVSLTLNVDRAQKGKVNASFSYARTTQANEQLLTRTESDEFRGSAGIDYYYSDKTGVRLNTQFRVSDFASAGFGDVESQGVGGGLLYRYSPKLTANLSYAYSPEKSVNSPNLLSNPNSKNHRISLGLEGELRPKVNGSISLGTATRSFDIGGSDQTMLLATKLSWSASEKTSWNITASNNFDTTPGAESAEIFLATLGIQHALTAKLSYTGSIGHQESTLDQKPGPVTRSDTALLLSSALTYRLNDFYSAAFRVTHRVNTSTLALAEYERSVVSLSLTGTF